MKAGERHTAGARASAGARDSASARCARELQGSIRGEVRFDDGSRALYATDASNYRQVPIGVVLPRDVDDVLTTVATARRHGLPVLPRGGGTSLAGQCCNAAVVMDFTKYVNRILEIDAHRKLARVEPGVVLDDLRDAAEQHHLTFGPDPSTHNHCALGGMIGNNSCGVHSVMAGRTSDNVVDLDVLTYDGVRLRVGETGEAQLQQAIRDGGRRGQIYRRLQALRDRYADVIRERFPKIPRRVSGYALDELLPENGFHVGRALCGSEGTCVTVLGATVRLVESPPGRVLLVLGYPDVFQAGDDVPSILEARPIGLEGMDDRLETAIRRMGLEAAQVRRLPEGSGWLLVEFGGQTREEATEHARALMERLQRRRDPPSMKLVDDPGDQHAIWTIREAGLGATARVPGDPDTWEGWEDSAVAPERLGEYLRELRALLDRYRYGCALYGHFGQGCVHTRIDFDLISREGIQKFRAFVTEAADLVLRLGGSLSGEHGDGQARGELLPKMYGPELMSAFREFKAIWDPEGRMNPGKVIDAARLDEHLRLGTDYQPPHPVTHFAYPGEDRGSFARAALRCVGVGECRRTSGGVMCPSYMVTREEKHSTRGRARLLFEMLEGDAIRGGWRDEHVKEALDLCFACKGCKTECPVQVDMATYKAEFLSHYYEGRLRPRHAYAFGLIHWWARLASWAPGLANFVGHARGFAGVAKILAGMAPERQIPSFAEETFTRWFRRRGLRNIDKPPVLLWPDTFNNHFHPETARAAVEVLEAAGYRVTLPARTLCCGRPLYDHGMLGLAKRVLRQVLSALRPQIAAGVPIVGLEPSCVAVFRDELGNLLPHDQDAKRLSQQVFMLSEFLATAPDYEPPRLRRMALVQGHCHQQAILGMEAEHAMLAKLGLDVEVLDAGCCGMAGSFGFEKEKYDVSMKAGERVLLPAVRAAPAEALIIANGFSCREQIAQATGRTALHLAEAIHAAMHEQAEIALPDVERPRERSGRRRALGAAALAGTGAVLVATALLNRRKAA